MNSEAANDMKDARFSPCGKYRYWLSRIWDTILPYAMCIGLNPSTANAEDDDPTIRNLTELLKANRYGGFYMVNLFAFITPNPEELRVCPYTVKDNYAFIEMVSRVTSDVIFCWGSFKQAEYRAKKMIVKYPDALCFGKTSKGKPIHPLAATVWMKSKCRIQKFNTI